MRFHTQTAGVIADGAAAAQQHRAHRDRGARRRARRHAVAAHQLLRRGARAADRGRGADRAAHAADHRRRDRRDEHDRPARRLVLRRGAHGPDGGARLRLLPPGSTSSAGWSRRSSRTTRSARSPTRRSSCSTRSTRGGRIVVGVNAYSDGDDDAAADPAHRPRARAQADRPPPGRPRRAATAPPSRRRSPSSARPRRREREPHARAPRRRARPRDRGRDRRRAAGRLGRLHRDARSSDGSATS